ncbi:hypothetical protein [Exiguobacterium sp. s127]|uniref:hypothetical protein n=1 Tax=Exiguobacterium sp. s127 TaxID=2751210 RepID=UPI001BE8EFFE|nr:hypothetical protein [Exiguobacterium sp. s127]
MSGSISGPFLSLLKAGGTMAYVEGESFFSDMPVFMVIFFIVILSFMAFALISAVTKGVSTNSLTNHLRHHASELVTPTEEGAQAYVAYLRSLSTFPVEKTNLEPVRLVKGISTLISTTDQITEMTKQDITAQYARLGLFDGEILADEAPIHHHSTHHSHHA